MGSAGEDTGCVKGFGGGIHGVGEGAVVLPLESCDVPDRGRGGERYGDVGGGDGGRGGTGNAEAAGAAGDLFDCGDRDGDHFCAVPFDGCLEDHAFYAPAQGRVVSLLWNE